MGATIMVPSGGGGGGGDVNYAPIYALTYGSDTKPYLKGKKGTYEFLASFTYAGTTNYPAATGAGIRFSTKGATTMDVRIYDVDNAQVIAEFLGLVATVDQVFETTNSALSNLPAAPANFETQIRLSATGGGREGWVSSLIIK